MSDHLVAGVLAPVDAGKTTLIEALLFESGHIREKGRVDHGNAFLDTEEVEKNRGITVYAKQAVIDIGAYQVTLIDTPGHRDFSAEMERTLSLMDYAVLVISAADGVTGYVRLLMKLLKKEAVPTFIFLNKMDQPGVSAEKVMDELADVFGDGCINMKSDNLSEEIAFSCDEFLEKFERGDAVTDTDMAEGIRKGKLLLVYPGSALNFDGTQALLEGMSRFMRPKEGKKDFEGRVGKISRMDRQRLTHIKVTGGTLKVRDEIFPGEKVTEIRVYDGNGYKAVPEAVPGMYVAVTGLKSSRAGMKLGRVDAAERPILTPLMTSRILFSEDIPFAAMQEVLKELEEEMPEIHVRERKGFLHVDIMGEIQKDILKEEVKKRSGIEIAFGEEAVLY